MGKQGIDSEPRKEIIIRVKRKKTKKSTYFLSAAAIIVLFILLTSAKKQLVETRTIAEEKYFVQVPVSEMKEFNITELYYERAQFTGFAPCKYKAYSFNESINWSYDLINDSQYFVCKLKVTNNENKEGEWEYFAFIESMTKNIKFEYLNQIKTIDANSSATFVWTHPVQDQSENFICSAKREEVPELYKCEREGTYSLIPKTRTVTTRDNVTHFVPVEQKRDVTTVKNETGYVNRFFGYRQPFYLGY